MAEHGFPEGKNITYTILNAQGDFAKARELLSSAIEEAKPDLVLTVATLATRAGRDLLSGTEIPQLFMIVTDPVAEGFVSAIGKASGSNITGQSHVVPAESQLALVSTVLETAGRDKPFRLAILRSTYPSEVSEAAQLTRAAHQFKSVKLTDLAFLYVPGAEGRPQMRKSAIDLVTAHRKNLDGIWLVAGPNQTNREFVQAVLSTGLPIVNSGNIQNARKGAMIALQSTAEFNGRAAAETAREILSGTPAGNIPVTRPQEFDAGVNISTAAKLGAVVPSEILELAQDNVFH